MGTYQNILASYKNSAADAYGRAIDGEPGMSNPFKNSLIATWQGYLNEISQGAAFSTVTAFQSQLHYYEDVDFGYSTVGGEVATLWSNLSVMAAYLDQQGVNQPYVPGAIDSAKKYVADLANKLGDGLTTATTVVVVAIALYLVVKLKE